MSKTYTCDLSIEAKAKLFTNLYKEFSKNLIRLEEILGGETDWTRAELVKFFDYWDEDLEKDTEAMMIQLYHRFKKLDPILWSLITMNDIESKDYE